MKWLPRAPAVFAATAYIALGAHPLLGALSLPLFFVTVKAPPRLDVFAAILAAAIGAGLGVYLGSVTAEPVNLLGHPAPESLHEALALGALAAVAVRTPIARQWGGTYTAFTDTLLSLVVVMAIGAAQPFGLYPYVATGFVLLALLALRDLEPMRPAWRVLDTRMRTWVAAVLMLSAATAFGFAIVLPPLHDRAQSFAVEQLGGGSTAESGFSDAVSLGDIGRIVQSDEVALRIYGPHVDHLRGVVYTRYARGRWYARLGERAETIEAPIVDRTVIIEHEGAPADRWFVPIEAQQIGVPETTARLDTLGVLRPPADGRASRVMFRIGARRAIAAPDPEDLVVPPDIRASMQELAVEWTTGATNAVDRLATIKRRLQTFRYTLDIPSPRRPDPVASFLLDHQAGHCEFFASGFVLLARSLGVPARMIGGYRVVEYNELAEHWTVRDRNAHAWVEAWLGDRWVTYDPTPASGLAQHMPKRASRLDEVADLLQAWIGRLGQLLLQHILWLGPTLFLSALLFLFRREFYAWWRDRRVVEVAEEGLTYQEPNAEFVALTDQLATRGYRRPPTETLESFATRLEDATLIDEATAVRRYAVVRYGGLRL